MKIAVLTPLPPVRSGIAHYNAMLLPELARRHEVTAVVDQPSVEFAGCPWIRFEAFEQRSSSFDAVICQLGNNVHHEFVWRWARRHPSVIVLHEIVLHHLLVETTLGRGDAEGLVSELRAEYGEAGVRVAEAREAGLHGELANFLLPASAGLAESSTHVIVHNEWAASRLRAEGVSTPITVVPHPFEEPPELSRDEIDRVRREAGWAEADTIIGTFGFVTHAKRPAVVMEAFAAAAKSDHSLRLVFVGEPAPNVDLPGMATRFGIPSNRWATTGYVTDRQFDLWLNVVDRVVSLRYPTAGESSGPIARAFAVGRPVAVNDYAQFAEYPASLVTRIPFDDEAGALTRYMTDDSMDSRALGTSQREWLRSTSRTSDTAAGYERALLAGPDRRDRVVPVTGRIPLFPSLDAFLEGVQRVDGHVRMAVRLTNRGASTLVCAAWGEPAYLLHATAVTTDGSKREMTTRLPCDLERGESTVVDLAFECDEVERLELRHGVSVVSGIRREPFAVLETER